MTEQSEPSETTATTTTVATTTASSTTTAETAVTVTQPVVETEELQDIASVETVEADAPAPETAEITTPDGRYTIAPTDIVRDDGGYTQLCNPGECTLTPQLVEYSLSWNLEQVESVGRHSNVSRIPYSEITIENAHEAFPYLGYIGYRPNYIEIFPGDSDREIASKIFANACGTPCLFYFSYSSPIDIPTHYFSSEADYNAWVAEQEAQRAAADAADQQAAADNAAGNYGFGNEDVTQEDIDNSLALFESLGF